MIALSDLILELEPRAVLGRTDGEVAGLAWDSRRVRPGDIFFALPGRKHDGHDFIREASDRGAVAVVGEKTLSVISTPYIQVENARAALAQAACTFYDHPTRWLKAIGVTGTTGKTTVVHLLGQLLPNCETLTTVRVEEEGLSCVTTPEAPDLQRLAAQALTQGRKFFAFEASSIGLAQHRVDGTMLAAAVITNLARDHLDFHGTMEDYFTAKLKLFRMLPEGAWAVANAADQNVERFISSGMKASLACGCLLTYGIDRGEIRAKNLQLTPEGAEFSLATPTGTASVWLAFPGRHNVENALAAAAVAWAFGLSPAEIAERLSKSTLPPGRFARLHSPRGAFLILDFAHTPDALARMLSELRPLAKTLICVFGCAGDSDRGKRPLMGEIAGRLADVSIVTSDNPKSEDPSAIAEEIAQGIRRAGGRYTIEIDRATAIHLALTEAGPGDAVLIAGKGHERLQWTAAGPVPYSDLEVLRAEGAIPLGRKHDLHGLRA